MAYSSSLQKRIFYLSLALILVPITLYSVFVIGLTVRSAQENFSNSMVFTMKKVGAAIDIVFSEVERASLFVIGSYDITNYLSLAPDRLTQAPELMLSAYNQQHYVKRSSDYIFAVQIQGFNSVELSSGPLPMRISQEDIRTAKQHNGQEFWNIQSDLNGRSYLFLCRLLLNPQNPKDLLGVTKLYLDTQVLQTLIAAENNSASYYLLDQSGAVVSSVNPLDVPLPAEDFSSLNLAAHNGSSFPSQIDGKRYYAVPYAISANDWTLVMVEKPLRADQQVIAGITLLTSLTLLCLILCFILADRLSRLTLKPLNEVMKTMKSIENEDFAARIEVKGQDEVARLATQFNQMASKINSLVDKVYKADIRKREAELRALQAQINPHFLYNTLDMIYWTAKMEQALETSDLINSLSHFFRSAFNPAGEYTTVSNEVEHLRYYIILLQQRKNHFDFNLEMDPDTSNCKTVKLILQPLVENSIIHGIENRENGQINILIQHRDDQLVYTVEDNGVGIDMADMEQLLANPLSSARGYGIRNVNDRISLAFGPEYGLRFLAKPEGGTIVTVVMPYLKEESE
jgi:two-component system sensor histidine kinase YesM